MQTFLTLLLLLALTAIPTGCAASHTTGALQEDDSVTMPYQATAQPLSHENNAAAESAVEAPDETNYLSDMIACCVSGDVESGAQAERLRNIKIAATGSSLPQVRFDDLFLLSKLIYCEAGSDWLSMDWKMKVGEVALNRVASPEFPDTLSACVYQPGQYSGAETYGRILPNRDSAVAAARLLSGERLINDASVVFQSGARQGSATYETLYDAILGYTFLCHSNNMSLYQ